MGLVLPGLATALPGTASAPSASLDGPIRVDAVEVELVAREAAIVPGRTLTLGLRLAHDPGWHTYWRNPGDSGLPTQLELQLPAGFAAGEIQWPAPQRLFIGPLANYGYDGEIVLPIPVAVPGSLPTGGDSPLRITGKASWLMCRDVCIPGEAQVSLLLPVAPDGVAPPSKQAALFDAARRRTPSAPLAARVAAEGNRLSIGLAQPLGAAEFFPYREGLIGNAEPQVLYAMAEDEQSPRRLDLRLSADAARALASNPALALQAAEGVLVTADQVFELGPLAAAPRLAGGVEIARAAGAPAAALPAAVGARFQLPVLGTAARNSGTGWPEGRQESSAAGRTAPGHEPATTTSSMLTAALFAVIGGLILNLMPCVFPVIGLKVLGFARHGGGGDDAQTKASGAASRRGAFAFSIGVLVSFWLLAALLLALRAAGQAAGWGFQLQSPVFVAAMALLFIAIALNLSGVWEVGIAMTRLGQYDPAMHPGVQSGGAPLAGSFGSGVLAVLVATPCTAPFMGSALGFTLTATYVETFIVFTALGLGMALPYLLLGAFPAWLRWLPRPGRWMESFRQALAFPMYAAAAWLAWVLGQQVGIDAVLGLALGALLIALAAWLYGRFIQQAPTSRTGAASERRRRRLAGSLAILALAVGARVAWPSSAISGSLAVAPADDASKGDLSADTWHAWSPDAVAQARAEGRPVFVDFTAAWCVSCQVNKQLVLKRRPIVEAMRRAGVLLLRADWTRRDPAISAELARNGRNGVPLYLLFGPDGRQPTVLPELLTSGIVLDALAALPAVR